MLEFLVSTNEVMFAATFAEPSTAVVYGMWGSKPWFAMSNEPGVSGFPIVEAPTIRNRAELHAFMVERFG